MANLNEDRKVNAQKAYEMGDITATVNTHATQAVLSNVEMHSKLGERVKSMVYGGMDGIITTFAIVSSSTGGGFSPAVILILGISNVIADGLSMGVGDTISTMSENDYIMKERAREEWELDYNKQGELDEMIELYEKKGLTHEDAVTAVELMAKYKDFFLDVMMNEELGLDVPDPEDNVLIDGAVTFGSFVFFGAIPLIGYVVAAGMGLSNPGKEIENNLFYISIALTAVTLFLLGAVKSKFTIKTWWGSGFEMMFFGLFCALVSWAVGLGLSQIAK